MSEIQWFLLIMGIVFGGVVVFATIHKMLEVRGASRWLQAPGRIVKSEVGTKRKKVGPRQDGPTVVNIPVVAYEFQVGSKKFRGDRVSIGEMAPNADVAQTLDRYPVGAEVTVYYDPANPRNSVLERTLPPQFGLGLLIALGVLGGVPIALALGTERIGRIVQGIVSKPEATPLVLILGGGAIFTLLLATALQRQAGAVRRWPRVTGRVTSAGMRSYENYSQDRWTRLHRPQIVYTYEVNGRDYSSDRVTFGGVASYGNPLWGRGLIGKYPPGTSVTVYFNPANPAESVLDPRPALIGILWIAGLGLALATAFFSGLLG